MEDEAVEVEPELFYEMDELTAEAEAELQGENMADVLMVYKC